MTGAERAARYRARVKAARANFIVGDEWGTPEKYIRLVREVMGAIDLDPASNDYAQQTIRAARYFTREDNGLAQPWTGRVWLNPPYSRGLINRFVDKLVSEWWDGNVTEAIVLTHSKSDTKWFRKLVNCSICYCDAGRIRHNKGEGEGVGNSPPCGSTFFYFGRDSSVFNDVFRDVGNIMWSVA